eukprot:744171-Prymnesium_polylepis.1
MSETCESGRRAMHLDRTGAVRATQCWACTIQPAVRRRVARPAAASNGSLRSQSDERNVPACVQRLVHDVRWHHKLVVATSTDARARWAACGGSKGERELDQSAAIDAMPVVAGATRVRQAAGAFEREQKQVSAAQLRPVAKVRQVVDKPRHQ